MDIFLLDGNVVISKDKDNGFTVNGQDANSTNTVDNSNASQDTSTSTGTGVPDGQTVPPQSYYGGGGFMVMIIWIVGFAAFFYFFMYRPQKKRDKQMLELRNAIETGDTVVTTSGLFGKVIGIGDNHFMVEFGTNKSVSIPILKTDVIKKTDMPK